MAMFRENNRLTQYLHLWLPDDNAEVLWGFVCNCVYLKGALAFLTHSSVVGFGSQRVNKKNR
jgi:hypothetical protein